MHYLHALPAIKARTGVALVAALLLTPAWALDLRQAYEAAEQNDATIRSARAGAEGMREKLPQARAQRRPNISFNAGANRNSLKSTSETVLGPRTNHSYYNSNNQALQLRQPLYRPFLSAQEKQAEAQVEGANAMLEQDEQGLVLRVSEA
jgi:outer membrane protein/protease secretion system outer membrane protein